MWIDPSILSILDLSGVMFMALALVQISSILSKQKHDTTSLRESFNVPHAKGAYSLFAFGVGLQCFAILAR